MAAPVLDAIAAQTIPIGRSLEIPLTATDADGDPVTFTASANNASVTPSVGNTWLQVNVSGVNADSTPFSGSMVFQLFNDLTPITSGMIADLAQAGFYNNLTFHRVLKGFVIQGGSPNGDGTGGPGFQFDDEINSRTVYAAARATAMARSSSLPMATSGRRSITRTRFSASLCADSMSSPRSSTSLS